MDSAITLLTLAVGAIELGVAGYYSGKAIELSRHNLMQGPKKRLPANPIIAELIWSLATPSAQHDYLLAHVFATVGFACLSALAIAQGPLHGGLLFISLTVVSLGETWLCWRKYLAPSALG